MSVTLLAIDTNTEACSVALMIENEILTRFEVVPRQHNQKILPLIDEILSEASICRENIDAIAMAKGPGAFTGVRITAGVVQGMAFGLDKPVIPVSTLAVLSQGAFRMYGESYILPAIDARMDEVYWAGYQVGNQEPKLLIPESVNCPSDCTTPEKILADVDWVGVGTGWKFKDQIPMNVKAFYPENLPAAEDLVVVAKRLWDQGKAVSVDGAMPSYLRNQVASPKKK